MNVAGKLLAIAAGRMVSTRVAGLPRLSALHAVLYRVLGGRLVGWTIAPVVLLTTRGRRSGRDRTTPLYGLREGQRVVVVGSNAGRGSHPDWYRNLRAQPLARVQVGGREWNVRARDALPDERDALWPRLQRLYRGYAAYREVAGREIPIVILEPV